MNVYDYVVASTIITSDQVYVIETNDPMEVLSVTDSGDTIEVAGYSHLSGDSVKYSLRPYQEVGLWTV
jgi:DNA-directed RNA polymerase subunit H (RpoH/RPB5)